MAKFTASAGAAALSERISSLFTASDKKQEKSLQFQIAQAKKLVKMLSELKGAAMKLGQLLSIYGEDFLPPEVLRVLSALQKDSDQLAFPQIEKIIKKELSTVYGKNLVDLSRKPIASASIGQVHEATYKNLAQSASVRVAVKVQYPGVEESIDSDVDTLAKFLSALTKLPNVQSFHEVIDEIKTVLKQETQYEKEGEESRYFKEYFKKDPSIVVPEYFPEISSKRVLSTEYIEGMTLQEFAESAASSRARNFIGQKFLEIFFHELLMMGRMQTDPNFANYKIQWRFGIQEPKLVLLDYGSMRYFCAVSRARYRRLIESTLGDDYGAVCDLAVEAGFLNPDDPKELVDLHYQLISLILEPFRPPYDNEKFHWGKSDIADRVRKLLFQFALAFKLRPPPREIVFLSRKLVGVYFFCSAIKAEYVPLCVLKPLLKAPE